MPFAARKRPTIRLTLEQDKRLGTVATEAGETKQAFALDAIVAAIEAAEVKNAARKAAAKAGKAKAALASPTGLGLDFSRKPEVTTPRDEAKTVDVVRYVGDGTTEGERRRRLAVVEDMLRTQPNATSLLDEARAAAGLLPDRFARLLRDT